LLVKFPRAYIQSGSQVLSANMLKQSVDTGLFKILFMIFIVVDVVILFAQKYFNTWTVQR